jgi:peptidoglycan/LPS O-acetylase OafA/YrhL
MHERGNHVLALDGVRGLAILSVFLLHYGGGATSEILPIRFVGNLIKTGWLGVSLFFVLSGFLISGILWDSIGQAHWRRNFYIRRSLRIFPLYYFALFITLASCILVARPFHFPAGIGVLAVYLQNLPPFFPTLSAMPALVATGHFWSLAVEEQFYLFWPFALMSLVGKREIAKMLCIALFIASLLFRISAFLWSSIGEEWAYNCLPGRMGELCAGAYLAFAIRGSSAERALVFRYATTITIGSFLLMLVVFSHAHAYTWRNFPVVTYGLALGGIVFTGLVAQALSPGPIQWIFQRAPMVWLGKLSYGIYVYHLLFGPLYAAIARQLVHASTGNIYFVCRFFVAAVLTILISMLSFYSFERPLRQLKAKFPMTQRQDDSSEIVLSPRELQRNIGRN